MEEEVFLKCSGIQIKQIPSPVVELYTRNNFLLDFDLCTLPADLFGVMGHFT